MAHVQTLRRHTVSVYLNIYFHGFVYNRCIGVYLGIYLGIRNLFFSVFVLQPFVCVEIASLSRYSVHFTAFVLRFFCVECNPGLIFSSFVERVAAAPHATAVINPQTYFLQ